MTIEIKIEGASDVSESLRGLSTNALILLKHRISVASSTLREAIVSGLADGTYGIRSRRGMAGLAGSVQELDPAETDDGVVEGGVVGGGPAQPHGDMFEVGGKGPYEIVAKPGSVLAWPGKGKFIPRMPHGLKHRLTPEHRIVKRASAFTAGMIFARRVKHPAMKQARWFTGPADDLVEQIQDILDPTDELDLEG
jgi:hypothetical protein